MASAGKGKRVLIIVENLPVPFDRRVWQESQTLARAGYQVSVICPIGRGYEESYQELNGIHIYRHPLLVEAEGVVGYLLEYASALFWEFVLSWRVFFTRGFDVIHACNPPDTVFILGGFYKLFGKKFIFDHHDLNPELYEAKFSRRDLAYRLLLLFERLTFKTSDASIATNESYRKIAIARGKMDPDRVFVVRSGPNLNRMKIIPPVDELKEGKRYLVGYVGVMGKQEGIDYLLRAVEYIVKKLKRTDIHFGLVGGGTSLEEMKRYAQSLGVADFVTFTGRAPDQQMLEMLNTADICVNPDVANEMNDKSTMNKVMEYMALGKALVQFDLAEGRVSAGEASLYAERNNEIDLAEKMVELLDNETLRNTMGEYGRQKVLSKWQWIHQEPKLLQAYNSLW